MSEPTHVAGRLEIPVDADLSRFDERLKAKVEAIANAVKAKVGIEWDDESTLRTRLQAAVDNAARGVTAKVKAKIDVDKNHVEQAAQSAATTVTKVLDKNGAAVKVDADDRASRQAVGILTRMKLWARGQKVEIPVTMGSPRGPTSAPGLNPYGPAGRAFRPTMMLGLLSLIQPLVAVIMQSLGGLVAMLGSVGASIYTLSGLIPMLSGLGAAIGAGLIAFQGLGKEGSSAVKAIKEEVLQFGPAWTELERQVTRNTWGYVASQIEPVVYRLFPAFRQGLIDIGGELGRLMRDGLRSMDTERAARDLEYIMDLSVKLTGSLGRGLGSWGVWFKNMTIAAGPFAERMGRGWEAFGRWAAALHDTEAERARFRNWLEYSGDKASELGRVLRNTWDALGGIFAAGRDSGDSLMATLEQVTEKWARWTRSIEGQTSMQKWFATAEEGTRAVGELIVEISKALARLGDDPNMAALVRKVTSELLPALETFLDTLGRTLGPAVIDLISNVLEVLSLMSAAGGPLAGVIGAFNEIIEVFGALLRDVPGLASALGLLLGAMIALRPTQFIIEGLTGAFTKLDKLGGGRPFLALFGLVGLLAGISSAASGADGPLTTLSISLGGMILLAPQVRAFSDAMSTLWINLQASRQASRMQGVFDVATQSLVGFRNGIADVTPHVGRLRDATDDFIVVADRTGGATGKLSGAMKNLWTAIGGGWGIALAGGIALLTHWWQENQKAKAAVDEHTQALLDNAGAMSEANRLAVARALEEEGAVWRAENLGVAYEDLLAASMNVPAGQQAVADSIAKSRAEMQRQWDAGTLSIEQYNTWNEKIALVEGAINGQNEVIAEAVVKYEKEAAAKDASAAASEKYGDAVGAAADETEGAGDAADGTEQDMETLRRTLFATKDGMDALVEATRKYREQNMSAREAIRAQEEGFDRAEEQIASLRAELGNLDSAWAETGVAFDENTQAGRDLERMFYDLTDQTYRAAEAAVANGASAEEVTAIWERGQGELARLAESVGLTEEGLKRLQQETGFTDRDLALLLQTVAKANDSGVELPVETPGLPEATQGMYDLKAAAEANPTDIETGVSTPGLPEAKQRVFDFTAAIAANPTDVETTVHADTVAGQSNVDAFNTAVHNVPDGTVTDVQVVGGEFGKSILDRVTEAAGLVPEEENTTVGTPGAAQALGWFQTLTAFANLIPGRKDTKVGIPGAERVKSWLDTIIGTAKNVPASKSTSVSAYVGTALSNIQSVINRLAGLRDRTVTVTTYNRMLNTFQKDGAIFNADGNVLGGGRPPVARFAAGGAAMPMWEQRMQSRIKGGFRNIEQHVAQILPAGAWRVWAEDETGGEAYIPLAPSKRSRSLAILRQVAERFGVTLAPTVAMAGGASVAPLVRSSSAVSSPGRRGGTRVVFEEGAIQIANPAPEPASKSVATIARGFTLDGLFETED